MNAKLASIQIMRDIVNNQQAERIRWNVVKGTILVDTFTARAIILCYDAGNEETKAKIDRMIQSGPIQFIRVASVCLKNVQ